LVSLPYDPGIIPSKPAPCPGETITIKVGGLPPYKDISRSIRNINHPRYDSFVALRKAATAAMDGRACYMGAVALDLVVYGPALHKGRNISDYAAGVEDTIDGSSGGTFTYLPIVIQDDCQVVSWSMRYTKDKEARYVLLVKFL
jgi:hypothetical protein